MLDTTGTMNDVEWNLDCLCCASKKVKTKSKQKHVKGCFILMEMENDDILESCQKDFVFDTRQQQTRSFTKPPETFV